MISNFSIPAWLYSIAILLASCSDGQDHEERKNGYTPELSNKEDSLFHAVMKGHDDAMAKMGKLASYIKKTQITIDSLKRLPGASHGDRIAALSQLSQDLIRSENGMNAWMEGFNADSARDNEAVRLQYLEDEKQKVNKVRDDIFNSLQKSDSLLSVK